MRFVALALLLAAPGLAACEREPPPPEPPVSIPFEIHGELDVLRGDSVLTTVAIEIADTDSTRQRGLMQRYEIPERTGMLFIFPYAQQQAFYMANTPRSLDIMYFGPDSALVNVAANTRPFDVSTVVSEGPAQFVLEMPAGFARRHGLVPGDRIRWTDRRFAGGP
ncbi:MAG: DUF192 domain-containing protein [Rubricoccaceae bacterium]